MMQESRGIVSSQSSRIEALQSRRALLKEKIRQEQGRPARSPDVIKQLKQENLRLKDEIHQETQRA
jgi:hypothetical protein